MLFDANFWSVEGASAVTAILTSTVIAGSVQVILKSRYDEKLKHLSVRLEADQRRVASEFEADLRLKVEQDLQIHRGQIETLAEKNRLQHTLLTTKRFEVAAHTYALLSRFRNSVMDFLQIVSGCAIGTAVTDPNVIIAAMNYAEDTYIKYYEEHSVYIPASLTSDFMNLSNSFRIAARNLRLAHQGSLGGERYTLDKTHESLNDATYAETIFRLEYSLRMLIGGGKLD